MATTLGVFFLHLIRSFTQGCCHIVCSAAWASSLACVVSRASAAYHLCSTVCKACILPITWEWLTRVPTSLHLGTPGLAWQESHSARSRPPPPRGHSPCSLFHKSGYSSVTLLFSFLHLISTYPCVVPKGSFGMFIFLLFHCFVSAYQQGFSAWPSGPRGFIFFPRFQPVTGRYNIVHLTFNFITTWVG